MPSLILRSSGSLAFKSTDRARVHFAMLFSVPEDSIGSIGREVENVKTP